MKNILAIALVIVSVFAIAVPAFADANRPWASEWNAHTLLPNTEPPVGSELRTQITNFQNALNDLREKLPKVFGSNGSHSFPKLDDDGIYGNYTTAAVKKVQAYYGIAIDGKAGIQTKNRVWNALDRTPYAFDN